ncbi:flavin monoamine oxidase family protein [Aquabacter cavernae]|uniref:flavin monoamine oxidase family protein n=1 Tax=Aquabacter cavernae TaxID=2496029 RepID=UPI000F8ED0C2|nr:NAD(P)/FAD-dependent oxidoreductase [Aquabacter cavernae]
MPAEFDVAVIGAGAAGLAAGRTLQAAGARFVVLEAASRTGGRAYTDIETFGRPWDMGCHWLHAARTNPFVPIADALGFTYRATSTPLVRHLWQAGSWVDADQIAAAQEAVDDAFEGVRAAGAAGQDIAASAAVPLDGPWGRLARHWLSLMTASPPERISARDFAAYVDTDANWPVLEGYGALVRAHGANVPVTLDCPVSRIDWSGAGVRLETPRGDVRARAVIVTVPVAVIAEGRLAFTPDLPPPMAESFAGLTQGIAEKVAIAFDRDVFGFTERTGVTVLGEDPVSFQILPGHPPLAVGHMGGDFAAARLADGPGALEDAMLDALKSAFGTSIAAHVTTRQATGWAADPFIGGAYSSALPGRAHLRANLLQMVGERIHFAGEAARVDDFSTCHGAHLSGVAAARRALDLRVAA